MQNFRNYYEILGVTPDASSDEIKKAFRRLARKYHPDVNPGDKAAEERFKDINEANEVLSDPSRRSQYDQVGNFFKKKGFTRKATKTSSTRTVFSRNGRERTSGQEVDYSEFGDFNSFVEQLLGRRPPRPGMGTERTGSRVDSSDPFRPGTRRTAYRVNSSAQPKNVEARLTLPLEKAYTGGIERIRLEDGRSLEVELPGNMITNQRVRLRGQGIAGGDLFLIITVAPHPFFKLKGSDIICQLPVTAAEAVLGTPVDVPTLDGRVKMNIPAGVQSGQRLRLANKGYPIEGERGDQLVEIQIVLPKTPSPQARELYQKLLEIERFNPRRDLPM